MFFDVSVSVIVWHLYNPPWSSSLFCFKIKKISLDIGNVIPYRSGIGTNFFRFQSYSSNAKQEMLASIGIGI